MAARRKEGYHRQNMYLHVFLCSKKGLAIDDVGESRDSVLQERYGRELNLKTGDFVKKTFGGLP